MSIRVTCHACNNEVNVKDELAGKDILCPSCQQRMTVPSIASGRPEPRPAAESEVDERLEDRERRRSGRDEDLPRWGDGGDYDVPSRRDMNRWSGTRTGLALIFWSWIFITIAAVILQGAGLAIGAEAQAFNANPGAQPPPGLIVFGFLSMGLGCVVIVLLILAFVGLCMCCTVPAESGAKGRAIASLVLVILTILLGVILFIVAMVMTFDHIQRVGPLRPGQLPFPTGAMIAIMVVAGVDGILLSTLWMMFHKAIADYFQNGRLARVCVWYLVVYIAINFASNILNFMANPMLHGGDLAAGQTPLMVVAGIVQIITLVALMVWYLFIVRETRRTILEDQSRATTQRVEGDDEDR